MADPPLTSAMTPPPKANLSTLPYPLLSRIAEILRAESQLKQLSNLAVTCRSVSEAVGPTLWREVKWNQGYHSLMVFTVSRLRRNVVQCIRSLELTVMAGGLEDDGIWGSLTNLTNLNSLTVRLTPDFSAPYQSRKACFFPPSAVRLPNLGSLCIIGIRRDQYRTGSVPFTSKASIDVAQSFPNLQTIDLRVPATTVTHLCTLMKDNSSGKGHGFPSLTELRLDLPSGSFQDCPARLERFGERVTNLKVVLKQWYTWDNACIPYLPRIHHLSTVLIDLGEDEHKGRLADILRRDLPAYLLKYRPADFVRLQDSEGEYDPGIASAVTMENIDDKIRDMGSDMPELERFSIVRWKGKASKELRVDSNREEDKMLDVRVSQIESGQWTKTLNMGTVEGI